MKEILRQLSVYNIWANNLLLEVVKNLPGELHEKEIASSFNSLLKTVLHMWNAESIWWQRMKLQERIVEPMENFKGNIGEAINGLKDQNRQWKEWIINAQEHHLEHVFQYQNKKGEQFKQPLYQMLIHLFNHGTYHRGQIVTMLRQHGVEKIPQTDFIVWSRKK
jgi:uncharacterized damage-inducible protein DinB